MSDRLNGSVISDMMADIENFHHKFGIAYDGKPRVLERELAEFRLRFMREELDEYSEAYYRSTYDMTNRPENVARRLEDQLDALVDLVYVAMGTAHMQGLNFREAWRRVHAANMRKERATTPTSRGGMYDVVKPVGWEPPNHADLVADHAHQEKKP